MISKLPGIAALQLFSAATKHLSSHAAQIYHNVQLLLILSQITFCMQRPQPTPTIPPESVTMIMPLCSAYSNCGTLWGCHVPVLTISAACTLLLTRILFFTNVTITLLIFAIRRVLIFKTAHCGSLYLFHIVNITSWLPCLISEAVNHAGCSQYQKFGKASDLLYFRAKQHICKILWLVTFCRHKDTL